MLERCDGVVDHVGIEAAAAALDEWGVDVERQAAGVFFEGALGLGELRQRAGLVRGVTGSACLLALASGQLVGLPRQGVGLRRPARRGRRRGARATS